MKNLITKIALGIAISFCIHMQAQAQTVNYRQGNSMRNKQLGHYYKMVPWDDSQYQEAAYWQAGTTGNVIEFMNWRIMFPPGYSQTGSTKYPMILMLHGEDGSGRSATGKFNYTTADPQYDNNDNSLLWGGLEHRDAVNKAASDPKSFPGIVVFPQVSYNGSWSGAWDNGVISANNRMAATIVEYLIKNYNADPDRVVVHGQSTGAKGVWDLAAKRPDLFAAILPMSGVGSDMAKMTDTLVTTPVWMFQGGLDTNPSQGYAKQWIDMLKSKGGNPRYTVYPDLNHGPWNTAYAEPDFFTWIKAQDKRNILVFGGSTSLHDNPTIKLGISAGYTGYQWMKNGVAITGANSRYFTATATGIYTVRFIRKVDGVADESFPVTLDGVAQPIPSGINYRLGNSMRNKQLGHYYKMVTWGDDSQYQEAAYWQANTSGNVIEFMNWRIMFPAGYSQTGPTKYPMILMLHGAGESGRSWTGNFTYTTADPEYDNNDNNLLWGGREHRDAVNKSATDPKSFPGIVVFPQVSYNGSWSGTWDNGAISANNRMAAGIVEYLIKNYNADPDRVVVHGLSNGAKGVWDLVAKRPDLFAAMLPMSGVGTDMPKMTDTLVTTPVWLFQGGKDTNPSPGYAKQWIDALKAKGGDPRYTLYPDLDHGTWNTAYAESDFFSWIKSKDKRNVYVFGGSTSLYQNPSIKLGISAGYTGYQWRKDGVDIPGESSRYITVTEAGAYTVRFIRRVDGVTDESFPVNIDGPAAQASAMRVYPNPVQSELRIQFKDPATITQPVTLHNSMLGEEVMRTQVKSQETETVLDLSALRPGIYLLTVGGQRFRVVKKE